MLELRSIYKQFGGNQVLRDVSIALDSTTPITGLIGPNGSGKSTLFHVVMGFYAQDSGQVFFNGQSLDSLPPEKRCHSGLSCTFQDSRMLTFMTVLENLTAIPTPQHGESLVKAFFSPFLVRRQEREIEEKARDILELLCLSALADAPAGSLSYGQRKLLEIGRVMMTDPQLVLLDEPSLGLSPLVVDDIFSTITTLNQQGISFLLVVQNARKGLSVANRGYVLESGQNRLTGSGDQLLNSPEVQRLYLGG